MKRLGIAKKHGSILEMPFGFGGAENYEVLELEGRIILVPLPFEPMDSKDIERLGRETIEEHREVLKALTR